MINYYNLKFISLCNFYCICNKIKIVQTIFIKEKIFYNQLIIWPAFANYLEDIKNLKTSLNSSEIIHIPKVHNSRADSLARSTKKQPSFLVHMDAELPVWFAESI